MVTNSMEIDASGKGRRSKEPKAMKKLRELTDELANGMPDEQEFTRQLDDFISKAPGLLLRVFCMLPEIEMISYENELNQTLT